MVVFCAEQKVNHKDCDSCAGHDHKSITDKQKAKHVIHLGKPDRVHDEVKFDEDGTKGEDTGKGHRGERPKVPTNWGDLAWDLVGAYRCLNGRLLEADPGTQEAEWHADDEPDDNHHQHGSKRNGPGSTATPDKEVEQEEGGKDEAGKSEWGVKEAELP